MTRTKTQERNESRAKCPPKARKRRAKLTSTTPRAQSLTGVRGRGPSVRNVQVTKCADRDAGHCQRCADHQVACSVVTWDYWLRGTWQRTKRLLCGKHANKLKARLGRAKAQR